MITATRIVLAAASLIILAACTAPDPVTANGGNEANPAAGDVVANDAAATVNTNATASARTPESDPMTKPDSTKAPPPAPKPPLRPEPLPSPTQPPAEVDPVREVDITDPG